jgi:uncharacterized membrane protein
MKRLILLMALMSLVVTTAADARVRIKGRGAAMNFDPAGIPEHFQAAFETMSAKCTKCHTMERTVVSIQTGRAPITGQPFNRQSIMAYGIKMLRKPNSDMSKKEIKDIVQLLNYLLEERSKP